MGLDRSDMAGSETDAGSGGQWAGGCFLRNCAG